MSYVLGFTDYDGTQVFLTHAGHTEYPNEATQFNTLDKALAARRLELREVRKNIALFSYTNGELMYVEEVE